MTLRPDSKADLMIVGRGIIGLRLALHFAQKGWRVSLFGHVHDRASDVATGVHSLKGVYLPEDDFFTEKYRGHYALRAFARKVFSNSSRPYQDSFQEGQVFSYFDSYKDWSSQTKRVYRRQCSGPFKIKNLSAPECGFQFIDDFWIRPSFFLDEIEAQFLNHENCKIFSETIKKIILLQNDDVRLTCDRGAQFEGSKLVLACGNGTPEILKDSGLGEDTKIDRVPGFTIQCQVEKTQSHRAIWVDSARSLVTSNQNVWIGSWDFGVERALREVEKYMKKIELFQNIQIRHGVRIKSEDNWPIIRFGHKDKKSIVVAYGFYRNGYALSEYCVREVEGLLTSKF